MKMFALTVATLALLAATGSPASAQYRPGAPGGYPGMSGQRPAFSPYLNLLNGGNPAINYYGIVRPQLAFQGAIQGLQQGQQSLEDRGDPTDPTLIRGTGHTVYFNNLSHYYFNDPSQPGGARGQGMGGGAGSGGTNRAAGGFGAGRAGGPNTAVSGSPRR